METVVGSPQDLDFCFRTDQKRLGLLTKFDSKVPRNISRLLRSSCLTLVKHWIVDNPTERSYSIDTGSCILRRNCTQLRPA